jgi:hypothetical protein
MPLLATTPSVPFSANQATALKPRVYPLGPDQPEAAIRLSERVDFDVRKIDPSVAERCQRFEWVLEKIGAELLVRQNLSDDQLHGSLRHDSHAFGRGPVRRSMSSGVLRHTRFLSNVAAALRRSKNGLNSLIPFSQPREASSGSTRRAYRRAADDAIPSCQVKALFLPDA